MMYLQQEQVEANSEYIAKKVGKRAILKAQELAK